MKMQMAITGRGGQGILFLTKILTECALRSGQEVICSETHGMAQRGGSVVSTLKIGPFRGPLIRSGQADLILALDEETIPVFTHLLAAHGTMIVNSKQSSNFLAIDATGLAAKVGLPLMANLILLGFALHHKKLFCAYDLVERVVKEVSPVNYKEANLQALKTGFQGIRTK